MKKIVLLLLLSFPVIVFAQNENISNGNNALQIAFSPTEVTASAVLELNYEGAQDLILKVYKDNIIVEEQTIAKGNLPFAKKLDFSTFASGPYTVKIFNAETEVTQFSITKL